MNMNSAHEQGSVLPELRPKTSHRRGRSLLSSFLALIVLAGVVFSADALMAQPASAKATVKDVRQTSHAMNANVPAFNNIGISAQTNVTAANFDGAGNSYSYDALNQAGMEAGVSFAFDGLQFSWPDIKHDTAPSVNDNWQANGQVLPLSDTGAHKVGFIGSASNGAVSGNALITYSDNSTQSVPLGFSDWTLARSTLAPSHGNKIFSVQPTRNSQGGAQSIKLYLFYASMPLDANKTPVSVTLPTLSGKPQIHVFAYSNTAAPDYGYNNVSMSNDAYTTAGNFDGTGNSYSVEASLMKPGSVYNYNYLVNTDAGIQAFKHAMEFRWPDVPAGTPDNYQANGQTISVTPVANAIKMGFVGAATGGPSYGTAYVDYTDGTRQAFTLGFSDWTLNGSTQTPSFGNRDFFTRSYHNTPTGKQTASTYLFYAEVDLQSGKTVTGVTLPDSTNQGQIHVFSIATGTAGYFDNVGISDAYNNDYIFGNLDGANHSYAQQGLVDAGVSFSEYGEQPFKMNGIDFYIEPPDPTFPDNWIANGQQIDINVIPKIATGLGFIGAATNGGSTGKGLITYTDGTTQEYTLSFSDWCAPTVQYGNTVVATMSYRNTPSGRQNVKNRLYYADVNLQKGKTVANVQLPTTTGGQMHIFAVGERYGNYNNTGISSDSATKLANLDGVGNSYSEQALKLNNITGSALYTQDGFSFDFGSSGSTFSGSPNNYAATGQTIDLKYLSPLTASNIGFILSSTNGGSSGTATITYYDGTTQNITIGASDWCDKSTIGAYNVSVAATMSYRNTVSGQLTRTNYLYFSSFAINASKRVVAITLPNLNQLHVFSIAFK